MANSFEQDETSSSLSKGQVVDADSDLDTSAFGESPEDVVRKLMDAETGGTTPTTPPHQPTPAPGKSLAKAQHTKKLARRLTATPRRVIGNAYLKARTVVLSYRPTPRHMAILLVVIIALTMPWLIPVLFLMGLIVVVISYLSLGHDRTTELVTGWYGWLMNRDPQGAEQLRGRAERVSARLAIWAGYLPQRWTAGLYLPDFARPDEVPDKMADDPFERLASDPQNR